MSLELGNKKWDFGFSRGGKFRKRSVNAGDLAGTLREVALAKERLGLPADAPVKSCYEAGRDGFWIHRFLVREGIENLVVDPASIEVTRRKRRRKTDRLDAEKLVRQLIRHWRDEEKVWGVVRVPSEAEEDARRLHREMERLKKERTSHKNRVRSLLLLHGVRQMPGEDFRADLARMRTWEDRELPEALQEELVRECERLSTVQEQIRRVESARRLRLKKPETAGEKVAAKLVRFRGVGPVSSWVLSHEFFGWRRFANRREVGALSGLTGTPYNSGQSVRDQGISKAGNKRIRYRMVELSWLWLRFQPESALSQWFWKRFGHGNSRARRRGIVALARKLLISFWKYLEWGEVPAGAVLVGA
jgi:transposase